jgi:hypothetical protein
VLPERFQIIAIKLPESCQKAAGKQTLAGSWKFFGSFRAAFQELSGNCLATFHQLAGIDPAAFPQKF